MFVAVCITVRSTVTPLPSDKPTIRVDLSGTPISSFIASSFPFCAGKVSYVIEREREDTLTGVRTIHWFAGAGGGWWIGGGYFGVGQLPSITNMENSLMIMAGEISDLCLWLYHIETK